MIEAPTRVERKLEKSGRITPRGVLEAYEETGLQPGTRVFENGGRGCAFGALMMQAGIPVGDKSNAVFDIKHTWLNAVRDSAGMSYVPGFYDGFDGAPSCRKLDLAWKKGWRDGRRVRKFVLSRYPELADE
jgi:hypothetical protein